MLVQAMALSPSERWSGWAQTGTSSPPTFPPTLVARTREISEEVGVAEQMSFVQASAEDLAPIGDSTVDVVTTRSVLICVDDKARAFREFFRVLRPGGRASLFEPINNYFPDTPDEIGGFDSAPVRDLVEKIWKYRGWGEGVEWDYSNDPMMNFNTKDLLRPLVDAGQAVKRSAFAYLVAFKSD
jgi:arsenite methyltransferase